MVGLEHLGDLTVAVVALRAVWLLPDWLAKWHRLLRDRRRAGPGRRRSALAERSPRR